MENDCFDFVGDLQYNCLGIFNELMKNRNRDDYFDKIGQDKIVYYSQHDIYSTNCSKVEKIDIPSEYNMTDDPTLCYDDIPVLYWVKKTDDNMWKEAVMHFREIVNRFYDSEETKHCEETKDGEYKTKYSFLLKDHCCTNNT